MTVNSRLPSTGIIYGFLFVAVEIRGRIIPSDLITEVLNPYFKPPPRA